MALVAALLATGPAHAQTVAQSAVPWLVLLLAAALTVLVLGVVYRLGRSREDREAALIARARTGLGSIDEGVITTDAHGRIRSFNPAAVRITGLEESEALGRPLGEILDLRHEDTHAVAGDVLTRALRVTEAQRFTDGLVICTAPGQMRAVELTSAPVTGRGGRPLGTVQILADVTALRALSRELIYHATHDALTGLLNRREFEKRVLRALDETHATGRAHVVGYIDLELFEAVNDVGGREAGDELLRQLSLLLRAQVRPQDSVARLGGDHFGLLLQRTGVHDGLALAHRLLAAVEGFDFRWGDQSFRLGASIGLAELDPQVEGLVDILRAADLACDSAKAIGHNQVQVFARDHAGMRNRRGEIDWVQRVKRALEESRFELHAQAIEPLSGGADAEVLYELLLRLRDEEGALIEPGNFIPAVERYDLGPLIDRWVLERALRSLKEAPAEALEGRCFTINLSGQTLGDAGFLGFAIERIEASGVAWERLCFEITETAAIADLTRARTLMVALRERGCRFALDDFGSGLSSLAYLKHLPVDYLKIDGTFIRDLELDPTDRALVESINQIGHVMGMRTVAEYVGGAETRGILRNLGVDYVQGRGVAEPRPLEAILTEAPTRTTASDH
jgi:diguanylate cyclase (GGDEF)-like protein/PAS domain S-box-containing protein